MPRLTRLSGPLLGLLFSVLITAFLFMELLLPQFEHAIMDQMIRGRGPLNQSPDDIAICAIDEDSIKAQGRWPWRRSLLAELIRNLHTAGARVIALDTPFSEPSNDDKELAKAILEANNVVLGFRFSDSSAASTQTPRALRGSAINSGRNQWVDIPKNEGVLPNVERLAEAARSQGFIDYPLSFGVVQHTWLVQAFDDRYFPSFPLSALKRFLDSDSDVFELSALPGSRRPRILIGERKVPINAEGLLWINYRGPAGTFETFSAQKVLEGETPHDAFRDRIVFVGVTVQDISNDNHPTPFPGLTPGVEIHATVAHNILEGDYLRDSGPFEVFLSGVALLTLGPLIGLCVAGFKKRPVGASVALLLVVTWLGICHLAFRWFGTHLQVVAPTLAGSLTLVATLFLQLRDIDKLIAAATRNVGKLKTLAGGRSEATLALVLTEVVGSTVSANGHDNPSTVRRAHFARIHSLLITHRGEEVDTFGDLFLAAFETAEKALDYAQDIQQETGHPGVRVRGGVHVGQIRFYADEPFGNHLHFLARISMMPEGAEIWISDQVKQDIDQGNITKHSSRKWQAKTSRVRGFSGKHTLWSLSPKPTPRPVPTPADDKSPFYAFLSYNRQDRAAVLELGEALKDRGLKVWLDEWELPPGSRWQDELEKIIKTARTAVVMVADHGLGPWEKKEMRACLNEFNKCGKPIIPVLLPGAPEEVELPLFLGEYTWLDLRDGLSRDGLDRLEWGITGVKPGAPGASPGE